MRSITTLSAAVFAMGIGFSATAQDAPTAETVVATVNGTEITVGQLLVARTTLPEQYQQLPDNVLFEGLLDQLIQQQVLADTNENASKRVAVSLINEERALKASEVIQGVADAALTDEALQAAYDARYAEGTLGTEYNANHILVETQEDAAALIEELNAGANFEELAKEKSTGPSGPNGGALGWFGEGMMVPPFEAAVKELKAGEISAAPVQTDFGWHVIKLNETREKTAPTLDEVRVELADEIQGKAIEAHIAELAESADVDRSGVEGIDPAVINNMDLLEQ